MLKFHDCIEYPHFFLLKFKRKNATTNLKILRDDSPAASQLIQWLKGSFDAMDRCYLKTFIMAVFF